MTCCAQVHDKKDKTSAHFVMLATWRAVVGHSKEIQT